jgi:uncharacterized caspase-like protein
MGIPHRTRAHLHRGRHPVDLFRHDSSSVTSGSDKQRAFTGKGRRRREDIQERLTCLSDASRGRRIGSAQRPSEQWRAWVRLHALLVGIDHYQDDRISNLRFAVADARRFHDTAVAALHPSEISTCSLYDEAATRPAILKAIGTGLAARAEPEDIVLIHFAGHGSPELNEGANATARYLVPYDAEYDNLLGTGIDMERDLTAVLQRLRARVVVVFLDACFSGRAGGRTFEGPRLHAEHDLRRWSPQLPLMELGVGRIVIAAADDDEVAIETVSAGHGLFSRAVIEALLDTSIDAPALAVSTLYDLVAARVTSETDGKQHPVMNGYTRLARIPYLRPTPTTERESESQP